MTSFQTFFRTVVMLATLGLLAKAWYHYGPSLAELQVIGARVSQVAQEAWAEYWQSQDANSSLADNPRLPGAGPAPFLPPGDALQPIHAAPGTATHPAVTGPVQLASGERPPAAPALSTAPSTASAVPALMPMGAPTQGDPAAKVLDELTQLGVRDQQLEAWGTSGQLYRFSCSAPWAQSPSVSRHFEAVADTPLAAVQQVAAEIHAWRGGQKR
jgi:hypothetical protein